MHRRQDQFRGALLGLAAGDALGYTVDDLTLAQIRDTYGPAGIQGYDMLNGFAEISAHTQLAMFTVNGLLFGQTRGALRGVMAPYSKYIEAACRDWAKTQQYAGRYRQQQGCTWLLQLPEMHARRRPEPLMVDALQKPAAGTMESPINRSRGCGGLTSAAMAGLVLRPDRMTQQEIDRVGAEAAALTHGDPMGFLPGAAAAHMLSRMLYHRPESLRLLVRETVSAVGDAFGAAYPQTESVLRLLTRAEALADRRDLPEAEAVAQLGGEDAAGVLAAAVYACLRYPGDFSSTIVAAVNQSGRSAGAGALAGCFQGAWLGTEGIPEFFLEPLELRESLEVLADDAYQGCPMSAGSSLFDDQWDQKYIQCEPVL